MWNSSRGVIEFALALSEAHELSADEVCELLRVRITAQRSELSELERRMSWALERAIPSVYWINAPYTATMLRAEVAHVETLITDIESGALVWHVPGARAPLHEAAATPPVVPSTA